MFFDLTNQKITKSIIIKSNSKLISKNTIQNTKSSTGTHLFINNFLPLFPLFVLTFNNLAGDFGLGVAFVGFSNMIGGIF